MATHQLSHVERLARSKIERVPYKKDLFKLLKQLSSPSLIDKISTEQLFKERVLHSIRSHGMELSFDGKQIYDSVSSVLESVYEKRLNGSLKTYDVTKSKDLSNINDEHFFQLFRHYSKPYHLSAQVRTLSWGDHSTVVPTDRLPKYVLYDFPIYFRKEIPKNWDRSFVVIHFSKNGSAAFANPTNSFFRAEVLKTFPDYIFEKYFS